MNKIMLNGGFYITLNLKYLYFHTTSRNVDGFLVFGHIIKIVLHIANIQRIRE